MAESEYQSENIDSPNDVRGQRPDETDNSELENLGEEQLREQNKQLFARAKKAETELKEFKSKPKLASKGEDEKSAGAPRERAEAPDYAEKFDRLTIRAEGIKDPDQIDFVLGAAKRLGVTVEEALADDIIQSKIKKLQEDKRVGDAIPSGSRRVPSSESPKSSPDYWVDREDLPEDYELRKQVVRERLKRVKSSKGLPHYRT